MRSSCGSQPVRQHIGAVGPALQGRFRKPTTGEQTLALVGAHSEDLVPAAPIASVSVSLPRRAMGTPGNVHHWPLGGQRPQLLWQPH